MHAATRPDLIDHSILSVSGGEKGGVDCEKVRADDRDERRSQLMTTKIQLVRGSVVAGLAAGLAIHKTVVADADVHHSLAQATKLLTLAGILSLLALRTTIFGWTGSGTHADNVAPRFVTRK